MELKDFLSQDVSWKTIKPKLNALNEKHRITQRLSEFSARHNVALRAVLVILFAFIVFWESWQADDAYHGYIMARHLAEGKGFVYNVGYRVDASTCPLLLLIEAVLYKFIHNMEATSVIIGVTSSAGAAAVLFGKFCKKIRYALFAFFAMILSYCFMSFTASGLENSLLFLFGALFLSRYFAKDTFNAKDIYFLALMLALLAMTRMDTVLIFIPMIVTVYLFKTKVSFPKRIGIGVLGLLPFVLWEVFSIFYYGFPFPNTLYAKVYSGYPLSDYLIKGLTYLRISFLFDCLLIIIPSLFLLLLMRYRSKRGALLLTGLLLYAIYVVRIGGDFMVGRHLTLNFFLALCGVCALLSEQKYCIDKSDKKTTSGWFQKMRPSILAICSLGMYIFLSPILKPIAEENFSNTFDSSLSGIADERTYYTTNGDDTIEMIKSRLSKKPDKIRLFRKEVFDIVEHGIKKGDKGVLVPVNLAFGYVVYYTADVVDMYLTDRCALMDPLLTRVPSIKAKYWRIGHNQRIIPDGYIETVQTGENRIANPSLHEFYDKMLLIITGNLFDKERLMTIWNMNTGKYDYLLEAYKATLKAVDSGT